MSLARNNVIVMQQRSLSHWKIERDSTNDKEKCLHLIKKKKRRVIEKFKRLIFVFKSKIYQICFVNCKNVPTNVCCPVPTKNVQSKNNNVKSHLKHFF